MRTLIIACILLFSNFLNAKELKQITINLSFDEPVEVEPTPTIAPTPTQSPTPIPVPSDAFLSHYESAAQDWITKQYANEASKAPWLYDPAQTFYHLWEITKKKNYFDEFKRLTELYVSLIADDGYFEPVRARGYRDVKYYNTESIANYSKSVDGSLDAKLGFIADQAWSAWDHFYDPTRSHGIYTERNFAAKLKAQVAAYQITGALEYGKRIMEMVDYYLDTWDDIMLIRTVLHEGYWDGKEPERIFSPWMHLLLIDTFQWVMENGFYQDVLDKRIILIAEKIEEFGIYQVKGEHPEINELWLPYYLAGVEPGPGGSLKHHEGADSWANVNHTMDVAQIFRIAYELSGDEKFRSAQNKLLAAYEKSIRGSNIPLNRPPRKFSWMWQNYEVSK